MTNDVFKNTFALNVFKGKYAQGPEDTWSKLSERVIDDVCGTRGGILDELLPKDDRKLLERYVSSMWFIPGGRYLYYAGRPYKAYNNCYLLRAEEDTREEWSAVTWRAMSCLMTGGGIGIDYSRLRPSGKHLSRTGGVSSGPIPLMHVINEVGRNVMQGGSRRSAIYASLNWQHEDIRQFLTAKNWDHRTREGKAIDFNAVAPLDYTNISVNYDDAWGFDPSNTVFKENCKQAMMTGEPGFSFNFENKQNETLRNAPVAGCTRVLTWDGYRCVEDLVGIPVDVWTGKQWATTTFVKTKSNVQLVEVVLSNGRSVFCDPEHPFVTWNKDGERKIPADELRVGQGLVSSYPENGDKDFPGNYGLGFAFGDGSIRGGRGEISYHCDEKKMCFYKACEDLGAYTVSSESRAYFKTPFWYQEKKFIPNAKFVAGWFDADGCCSRNMLRLSCKNVDNLYELREYFDTLGIKSVVREDGHSSYVPSNPSYTLHVYKESFVAFNSLIPTIRVKVVAKTCRKQNILVKDTYLTDRYEDVYCCDVGVEEHSFMAEGVLLGNCTEVTSEDDSDVCNLGSINLGNISTLEEFKAVVQLGTKFLVCGTLRADLPYEKVYKVREKNRRLGLGLMGIHEWLLKRGYGYEVPEELKTWLQVYKDESERTARELCDRLSISRPVAFRAIAPTGTIGILAGTTTGIEPLFAVSYKRRYLTNGNRWKYEYVVDSTADLLIKEYGLKPESIDTAYRLSHDFERRIRFQADIQDYVDMSISSTINLPQYGTEGNEDVDQERFASTLAKYAPRLRGLTCYPDGSRGGQPLVEVDYEHAIKHKGVVFEEHSDVSCKSGVCGI